MTGPNAANDEDPSQPAVPRRDWLLLPALGLLTILLLAGSVELISRRVLIKFPYVGENCLTVIDPAVGAQGIPNCVVTEKISEGVVTEYKFNRSGYRDNADFSPKHAGTYRIVLVGSSIAAGFRVPEEQTLTMLLPAELSQRTGRKVEVYSEGLPWRSPRNTAYDLKDAIAVNPDMICDHFATGRWRFDKDSSKGCGRLTAITKQSMARH